MAGLNKATLIGRLGKDPELRQLNGGKVVCNFSLATSESYKDANGSKKEITEWHNIVVWGNLAEVAGKYLHKGDLVYLEGRIQTRSWDNNQGGKSYTTEIVVSHMTMLSSKNQSRPEPEKPKQQPSPTGDNDDLPF